MWFSLQFTTTQKLKIKTHVLHQKNQNPKFQTSLKINVSNRIKTPNAKENTEDQHKTKKTTRI
jgi:hypothetical protein